MITTREKCERQLKLILSEYNAKRKIKDNVTKRFKKYGLLPGDVSDIFSQNTPIETLSTSMLCLFTKILYEETKEELINTSNFFTELEIQEVTQYKKEYKKFATYPILFNDVIQDSMDDFSTVLDICKLAEFINNRVFKYNPETQRPLISKFYNNREIKEIDLNKKSREAITKNIIDGKQIPNTVTINILHNGEDDFEYNDKNKTLKINSGEIDIIDGYHRILAAWFAYNKKPTVKFYYKLRIVNWDVEKAKAFIYQETLGNKIDPNKANSYNVNNPYNIIVNKLNENPKSNVRGKITNDKLDIKSGKSLIMFDVLFDSIKVLFNVKDSQDIVKVGGYLREGINIITDEKIELLKEVKDDRLWVSYLIILHFYHNKNNWQSEILNIIDKVNQEELLQIPYHRVNKILIDKIKDHLQEKEVCLNV
jgi:hypothetical protein